MSHEVFLAVLRVAASWGLLWVLFAGLGLLLRRLWSAHEPAPDELPLLPWLGWAGSVAFLQIWHLVWPVNGMARLVLALLGVSGLAMEAPRMMRRVGCAPRWHVVATLLAAAVTALFIANHAVRQPAIYDSGLYHLSAVRWASEFSIMPGLANLHGRLGYNNSSFLYTALLDMGSFRHRSHQLASGFLVWITLILGVARASGVVRRRGAAKGDSVFYALLLAPIMAWAINSGYLSSPSPDVPCFLMGIVIGGELLRHLRREDSDTSHASLGRLCMFAVVGVTVKLSFAVFAAVAVLIAYLAYAPRTTTAGRIRGGALLVGLGALAILPWCARGVMMSGYPLYPATVIPFAVDWAVSPASAREMAQRIQAWARLPGAAPDAVLGSWAWLRPWLYAVWRDHALTFTAPLATLLLAAVVRAMRRERGGAGGTFPSGLVLVPCAAGTLAWFFAAPDPRFLGSLPWVAAAAALASAVCRLGYARMLVGIHAVLVLALFVNPVHAFRTWNDAGPARQVSMRTMLTPSGLGVLVPETGDQCWDSPLPATPYYSPRLRLRVPGDLASGFTKAPMR